MIKTGLIRDKFYDKSILAMVKKEKVKEAMRFNDTLDEDKYAKEKFKVGINEQKRIKGIPISIFLNNYLKMQLTFPPAEAKP